MFIRGLENVKSMLNTGFEQLKIKPNTAKQIRIITPADEIPSIYEHVEQFNGSWKTVVCIGKNECPLCQAGRRASFKSYILVIDREDDKVKLFKASRNVVKSLLGLVEEYGDITQMDFKIYRQGEKLDTVYQFFPKERTPVDFSRYEIPDVESLIKVMDKDEILALMSTGTGSSDAVTVKPPVEGYPF